MTTDQNKNIAYLIKVIYKSGATHEFWVKSFAFTGVSYQWETLDHRNKPIEFGASEVAAVWQIDYKFLED